MFAPEYPSAPGFTWFHLVSLGFTLHHLGSLGVTRSHLASLGFIWHNSVSFGITQFDLASLSFTCSHWVSLRFTCCHSVSLGVCTWVCHTQSSLLHRIALLLVTATFIVSGEDTHPCGVYLAESSTGHILGSFVCCTYRHNGGRVCQAMPLRG